MIQKRENDITKALSVISLALMVALYLFVPVQAWSVTLVSFILAGNIGMYIGRFILENSIHLTALGVILRPQVFKWLTWLRETNGTDKETEPWLPKSMKTYLIQLGVALQFDKHRREDMERKTQSLLRNKKKKAKRGKRG